MTRSWIQLFNANLKMLYRNWRGLFWTILFPLGLYIGLSVIKVSTSVNGVKVDYSSYLLPGMVALTIAQTGVFGLAYWLVDLKEHGVLKRLQATPMSDLEMLSSLISTRLIVMLVQVALLTVVGIGYFHAVLQGSAAAVFIFSVLGGASFLSIGFLISTISKNYDEASPITTAINLIFTFLGNVFFPTDILPKGLRIVGHYLPITYLADGLRNVYLSNNSFFDSWQDLLALLAWTIALFAAAAYMFKRSQKM